MEGAGLYAAAREAKVDWILTKGICDWADGTKNDDAQPLAARNAAQFVLHVVRLGDGVRNKALAYYWMKTISQAGLLMVRQVLIRCLTQKGIYSFV